MYRRIGLDVILRAERRGRKNQCPLLYLIPAQGSAPVGCCFVSFLLISLYTVPESLTAVAAVILVIEAGQFVALEETGRHGAL